MLELVSVFRWKEFHQTAGVKVGWGAGDMAIEAGGVHNCHTV